MVIDNQTKFSFNHQSFNNGKGNCVPRNYFEGCPEGYISHDDEKAKCIPNSIPCREGYVMSEDGKHCLGAYICKNYLMQFHVIIKKYNVKHMRI
jgi:hypothetical protein